MIELIRKEAVAIDVGFWFMEDTRYATELIRRWQAGVPVRVVMDARAVTQYGYATAGPALQMMKEAGIPMRTKTSGGIFHFKTMIFAGQGTVQFSAANYSSEAFVPLQPYVNYVDEIIYFSDDASIVGSFMTRFDDVWTDTTSFATYANVAGALTRRHPQFPIAPELNFAPWQNFRSRSVAQYRQETQAIDAIMYRITDRAHSDAMIAAVQRGVPVRLITEPHEYRSDRVWHSWNVDRMYAAGVQVRVRKHAGLTHEKLTILNGRGLAIFGSSNWTSASATSQHEHNLFTTDSAFVSWVRDHFDRKWTNRTGHAETEPFVPLPPDTPVLVAPADGAASESGSVTLKWYAGPWAHKYDVYLGTDPSSLTKVLSDRELGPSESSRDYISWTVSGLIGDATYYWRVVSRTMANLERASDLRSFRTGNAGSDAGAGVSITSSVPSPQPAGASITFHATFSRESAAEFKWLLYNGSTWTVLGEWGAGTVTWTPTQPNRNYRIGVWARTAGGSAGEAAASIPFVITGTTPRGTLTISAITPSRSSPQLVNTSVTFTAVTADGSAQFKWLLYNGSTWSVLREWGGRTYTWTPRQPNPNYRIGVWARRAGATDGEAAASISYSIRAPLVVTAITANVPVIRAGAAVTFTATATGGAAPYQFTWLLFDGRSWSILRSWGPGSITWTPSAAGSGFRVGVWARSAGATGGEATAATNVSVMP